MRISDHPAYHSNTLRSRPFSTAADDICKVARKILPDVISTVLRDQAVKTS
jgi:hypothetical protein